MEFKKRKTHFVVWLKKKGIIQNTSWDFSTDSRMVAPYYLNSLMLACMQPIIYPNLCADKTRSKSRCTCQLYFTSSSLGAPQNISSLEDCTVQPTDSKTYLDDICNSLVGLQLVNCATTESSSTAVTRRDSTLDMTLGYRQKVTCHKKEWR